MNREVELIECVKKHHVIWNPSVVRKQKADKIKGAWRSIAENLHLEESMCRKKWAKLRYGFNCFTKNTKGDSERRRTCKNAHLYKLMEFLLLRKDAVVATVDQKCSNKQKQKRSLLKGKRVDENPDSISIASTESKRITNMECWNGNQHQGFEISKNTEKSKPLKVITLPSNGWPKVFINRNGIKSGLVPPRKALIKLATSNKLKPQKYTLLKYQNTKNCKNSQNYANCADAVQNFVQHTSKINENICQAITTSSLRDFRILSKATQDETSPLLSPWPWSNYSFTWQSPLDTIIIKSQSVQHNKDEYLRYAINAAYGLPCKRMTVENEQCAEPNQGTPFQKYIQGEVESYFR